MCGSLLFCRFGEGCWSFIEIGSTHWGSKITFRCSIFLHRKKVMNQGGNEFKLETINLLLKQVSGNVVNYNPVFLFCSDAGGADKIFSFNEGT